MNSIDKLISLANVRGSLDLRCQFQGDWSLEHEQEALGKAPYHVVLSGGASKRAASFYARRRRSAPAGWCAACAA